MGSSDGQGQGPAAPGWPVVVIPTQKTPALAAFPGQQPHLEGSVGPQGLASQSPIETTAQVPHLAVLNLLLPLAVKANP